MTSFHFHQILPKSTAAQYRRSTWRRATMNGAFNFAAAQRYCIGTRITQRSTVRYALSEDKHLCALAALLAFLWGRKNHQPLLFVIPAGPIYKKSLFHITLSTIIDPWITSSPKSMLDEATRCLGAPIPFRIWRVVSILCISGWILIWMNLLKGGPRSSIEKRDKY